MQNHPKMFVLAAAVLAVVCLHAVHPALATPANAAAKPSAVPARAGQLRYAITDLGTLSGGTASQAAGISLAGVVAGGAAAADGSEHAVLWVRGRPVDIGPEGMNSDAFAVNLFGQASGQTEIDTVDPYAENFCGYGTGRACRPFVLQNGVRKLLPLLGGNNGTVGDNVNLWGQVPGVAETAQVDADCPRTASAAGTGPQRLAFRPVVWGPKATAVRELPLLPGDHVGMAFWVNNAGQAVGLAGTCANTTLPPLSVGYRAVLWERDGRPVDLGNLGGTGDPGKGVGNVAHSINDFGQVVGVSALADNAGVHGFIWTRARGMRSLDPLPGQPQSGAVSINNLGDAVGVSLASDQMLWDAIADGNAAAVVWKSGGAPADLNELAATPTSLYLLFAFDINDVGEIVGFGVDTDSGKVHGFRATPIRGR